VSDLTDEQRHILPRKPDGSKYGFLIVDDSDFMVKNLVRIVQSFEGEVIATAENGAEAVLRYRENMGRIDCVTLDITMPKMSGLEALELIRKDDPRAVVVMVSALGHKEAVQQAILKGAKHFVVKPFQRESVYKVFLSILPR
jgi:two-component system, chemotaxis family, chemotaxis protein CheY